MRTDSYPSPAGEIGALSAYKALCFAWETLITPDANRVSELQRILVGLQMNSVLIESMDGDRAQIEQILMAFRYLLPYVRRNARLIDPHSTSDLGYGNSSYCSTMIVANEGYISWPH